MRRWIIGALVAVGAVAVCTVFLSGTVPARPADSEVVPHHAQQLARVI